MEIFIKASTPDGFQKSLSHIEIEGSKIKIDKFHGSVNENEYRHELTINTAELPKDCVITLDISE